MKNGTFLICACFIFLLLLFTFIFSLQTPSIVLLSFDVEPVDGDKSVLELVDLLNKTGTKATFFFLGKYAEQYPQVVKQTYEEGHEIACHGYSHTAFTELNYSEKINEIYLCKKILFEIVNKTPAGFRAPYNKIDQETYLIIQNEFDYDASQISGWGWLYPNHSMPEILISSIFLIPAEDVIWLYYLHLPEKAYFYLLKHKSSKVSYLFHPHHISSPERLKLLESFIMDLKASSTNFIKHSDFIPLRNDNR